MGQDTGYPGKKGGVGGVSAENVVIIAGNEADGAVEDHIGELNPHPEYVLISTLFTTLYKWGQS